MAIEKFTEITEIPSLDRVSPRDAHKAFNAFIENGIIVGGSFDDNKWLLYDERTTSAVSFDFKRQTFNKLFDFLGMDAEDLLFYMKVYVLCTLGKMITHSIQAIIREIRYVLSNEIDNYVATDEHGQFQWITHVNEFFSLLPVSDRADKRKLNQFYNKLFDAGELLTAAYNGRHQRTLASFDSYFKFNEIILRFWKTGSTEQKLFFFPVYLWWQLSGVIPMRPVEFVLTPRDCLFEMEKESFIRIRKTKLKGRKGSVTYKICSDYEIVSYSVRDDIAEAIRWYIAETDSYGTNDLHTLFCVDTHYSQWDNCTPYTSKYFTYTNMTTCLRYFYKQIIEDEYHYTVLYERTSNYLQDQEIHYLHLGDTRHLSLINMISQGATPVVAMMLAGHKDISITSHYYSNYTRFIECKTYHQYKALSKGQESYTLSVHKESPTLKTVITTGHDGRCCSSKYVNGNFEDCKMVAGPHGEIGYCEVCQFFLPDRTGLKDRHEHYQHRIKEECALLSSVVGKVRQNRGDSEDITQVLLNLHSAEYTYQKFLEDECKRGNTSWLE